MDGRLPAVDEALPALKHWRPSVLKAWFLNVLTGLMVGCALIVTILSIRRELVGARRTGSLSPVTTESNWADYAAVGRVLGPPDARVTIVEFGDFECPYCRRFAGYVDSLRSLGASVKVVYKHFPLPNHRFAVAAATASECSGEQGQFDSMHAALYAHPESIGVAPWWWFANAAGVRDSVRFNACIRSSAPSESLRRDSIAGDRLDVRGTPTLLIQQWRFDGLPPFDTLRSYVERAAKEKAAGQAERVRRRYDA